MLAPLINIKQKITLIQDSGIQFLDFTVKAEPTMLLSGHFVRQTANGPLLILEHDIVNDKYSLHSDSGQFPEIVKPELSFTLQQSLDLLDGVWLPLPVMRCLPPRHFIGGPENWSRIRLQKVKKTDKQGVIYHACLAFDTQCWPDTEQPKKLALHISDAKNHVQFALAWRNYELREFLDLAWIDSWLREVFSQQVTHREHRTAESVKSALREFEYQAHYLNLLKLLGQQLPLNKIKIRQATLQKSTVAVDLVLDVGNSQICGILAENHPDESNALKQVSKLQLRDLAQPHQLYNGIFESRLEFSRPSFGKSNFSLLSGHEKAFVWPSLVRIGPEAQRLSLQRSGNEGSTGLSSPRRYLWDEAPWQPGWRFHHIPEKADGHEPPAVAEPLMNLLNDGGQPLYLLPMDERLPVFSPCYSRSSLMHFMLSELLAQALMQINSVSHRMAMPCSHAPRQLRRIILTLPAAMPAPERDIFHCRMTEAIALVWKARGWHSIDESFSDQEECQKHPPDVVIAWDEATSAQMVYLFNETQVKYGGRPENFFANIMRPDRPPTTTLIPETYLRIASIDIGGGRTDIAITDYILDEKSDDNIKIHPHVLCRDGVNIAGDDILLDIIQRYIMPTLQEAMQRAGWRNPEILMAKLFNNESHTDACFSLRQQVTLQILKPIAERVLQEYQHIDPQDCSAEINATFGELLSQRPTSHVLDYIQVEAQQVLRTEEEKRFDILQVPLIMKFSQLHTDFLTNKLAITQPLRLMADLVAQHSCDILLLTGEPSALPGIQALLHDLHPLPADRILPLLNYYTGDWYPFNKLGHLSAPKSTAAVGALLCQLAIEHRFSGFCLNSNNFRCYSTLRYLGRLDAGAVVKKCQVYYSDIDLNSPIVTLDPQVNIPVYGKLCLGFRQLDDEHWPASPLYTLIVNDQQLADNIATGNKLNVKLKRVACENRSNPVHFEIADAHLADGSEVPLHHLSLNLNTLSHQGSNTAQYWIDSGKVLQNTHINT